MEHTGRVSLPVFLQPWWLQAARSAMDKPYREARVFRDGMIAGYLGYTLKKNRMGIRSWEPFDWCRVNEPVLSQSLSDCEKADVLRALFDQLPRDVSFEFVCGPTARDLPLIGRVAAEKGFEQRREIVFWQAPEHSKNVLQRVSKKYRNSIRRAAEDLEFVALSADGFVRLYDANLRAAGRRPYSDSSVARQLIVAGLKHLPSQVRIIAVKMRSAPADCPLIDAAIVCVWDDERYYYWMTTCSRFGTSEVKAHPHAVKYLLVTAIQDAGARGLIFDTDGGDTAGAAKQFKDLRFEYKAERIIFMRHKLTLRLYNRCQQRLKNIVMQFGQNPSVRQAYYRLQLNRLAGLLDVTGKRHAKLRDGPGILQ